MTENSTFQSFVIQSFEYDSSFEFRHSSFAPTSHEGRTLKNLRAILLRLLTTRVAWPIVITITLLSFASLRALALSSPDRADRQQIHILVGLLTLIVALLPSFQTIGRVAYAAFAIVLLLLIAVLFAPAVQSTHRWFVLPAGVQLQPSEFAKLAFILATAWLLRHRKNVREIEGLIAPFLLAVIPFGLILIEPDLGTALLFPLILYAMLIAAGARFRHLLIIALILPLVAWGYFPFLHDYQKNRSTPWAAVSSTSKTPPTPTPGSAITTSSKISPS